MATADIEKAVKAVQLYAGCPDVRIKDQQKLYSRMNKAIERVATKRGMSSQDAHDQIVREAARRGRIVPLPGKDI